MLSEESLKQLSLQAKHEINENEEEIPAELAKLEALVAETYPDLHLPPDFQCFLVRSLRARKFNLNRAAKLVSNYFKLLHRLSDMHNYLVPATNDMLAGPVFSVLKHRDALGRKVVFAKYETVSPQGFDQVLGGIILINEVVNQASIDTQRIGIVLLVDYFGYSFAHLRAMRLGRIFSAAKAMQDSTPIRLKGIHIVRNPAAVTCLYTLSRPFLTQKLRSRIHFHGYDFKSLHKHLSPEILPEYLGGALPDNDYAERESNTTLLAKSDYFREVLKYGYTS